MIWRQSSPQLLVKSATTLRVPFLLVASESRYLRMPPYSDTTEATERDSMYSTNPVNGIKKKLGGQKESSYLTAFYSAPEFGDVARTR